MSRLETEACEEIVEAPARREARLPLALRAHRAAFCALGRAQAALRRAREEEEGQGTTEYAILVGVLVVIAIVAIAAFRGKVQNLWDSIANAVNGL